MTLPEQSDRERAWRQSAAVTGQSVGYEQRMSELYDAVRACGVNGASCSALATKLGWTSHETRAKLMSLRTRDCVFYDAGVWFT